MTSMLARAIAIALTMLGLGSLAAGLGVTIACATPSGEATPSAASERRAGVRGGPSPATPPAAHLTRRAVIVGIDRYTTGPEAPAGAAVRWRNLAGAARDAQAMESLLIGRYDFPRAGITLLLDRAATRSAIVDALEREAAAVQSDDEVVFFYAGHGSQVPNAASDEPDKLDESLVPADSNAGADDLRDKVLARLFNRILDRGARLTVIFDTCYGGSLARGLPPAARPRFLPPASRGVVDSAPTGGRPEERALILSAARDFELALEADDPAGERHGAFSLALITAMRRSPVGEPAEDTFLRARGLLQTSDAFQQPVIAGPEERRRAPLFGRGGDGRGGGWAIAVQRVEPNDQVLLQGGWAHGLSKGVELEVHEAADATPPLRLQVTRVLGPAAAEARIVETRQPGGRRRRLASGDLATLSRWARADQPTLRVWIPNAGAHWQRSLTLARELRALAAGAGVTWIADAVESTPTHVMHWDGGWWLTAGGQESRSVGVAPLPRDVLRQVTAIGDRPPSLLVQLPAPSELAAALALGAGTDNDAVERSPRRDRAHYQLVGRLAGDDVDFAWVRPNVGRADAVASALPPRSAWCSARDRSCALTLTDAALRLNKIRAWLVLESPPGVDFPYHLWLVDESGAEKCAGSLRAGERYALLAKAPQPPERSAVTPRHLYVFTIDSFGKSTLLFPRGPQGSVENRFPVGSGPGDRWPGEIHFGLQPAFRVAPPFGTDTFFLLSSEEPIPNPWVVQFPGVRSRGPRGATSLEDLLSQTGSAARGVAAEGLPVTWSLERLTFETVGPPFAADGSH